MQVLDDEGRLFGVVNVVDALAVLLFVSLLVAGMAVVVGLDGDSETATRYATVELGPQPAYIADRIDVGDRLAADPQAGNLTVTDVFVTGANVSGTATVYTRVKVEGHLEERPDRTGRVFTYAGQSLPIGSAFNVSGTNYTLAGPVTALDTEGETLETSTLPVRVESTVPRSVARTIAEGDEYRLAGRTVATITDVASYPTSDPDRQFVSLGLELRTVTTAGTQEFAGAPVTLGTAVPFRSDAYELSGQVTQRGDASLPGEATTTRVTVELKSVSPAVATELSSGATEVIGDRTLATVRGVRSENATVVIASEPGEIFAREHPVLKDVTLTLDLQTRQTDDGLRFHGRPLAINRNIAFDFGTVRITGTVTDVER
jgi:hypothetical protein